MFPSSHMHILPKKKKKTVKNSCHNTRHFCTFRGAHIMLKYYTDIMQIFIVFQTNQTGEGVAEKRTTKDEG